MPSNKEVLRFSSYVTPAITVVKYIDTEAADPNVMYDLYLNGKREQRYDIQGLLYRLELMFRTAGFEKIEKNSLYEEMHDSFKNGYHAALKDALEEKYTVIIEGDPIDVVQVETLEGLGIAMQEGSNDNV